MDNLTSMDQNLTYLPLAGILIVARDDEQRVIA